MRSTSARITNFELEYVDVRSAMDPGPVYLLGNVSVRSDCEINGHRVRGVTSDLTPDEMAVFESLCRTIGERIAAELTVP